MASIVPDGWRELAVTGAAHADLANRTRPQAISMKERLENGFITGKRVEGDP